MDIWLYYDVVHRLHDFMNPLSEPGYREFRDAFDLPAGARILDVGCGKGEMLVCLALDRGISGVGVDISPYCIRAAGANKAERAPGADLQILEMKGEDYAAEHPGETFDAAMCIGASWIWDGYEGTLAALKDLAKPGGLVVLAEPYWILEPSPEYLESEELQRETFTNLEGLLDAAGDADLDLVWMRGSSQQEWDRYQMLQTASLDRFAREEPDHPDLEEIRERTMKATQAYLREGRDAFGFALWIFRRD